MLFYLLSFLFLIGIIFLTALPISLNELGRIESKRVFYRRKKLYFFYFLIKHFFPQEEWEDLFFLISSSKQIIYISYAVFSFYLLLSLTLFNGFYFERTEKILNLPLFILGIILIVFIPLILIFAIRPMARIWPKKILSAIGPSTFLFLAICSPFTIILLKLQKLIFSKKRKQQQIDPSFKLKHKIIELLHDPEIQKVLDPRDQKLITSVISFQQRIVKEIMIPRVDMVCLSIDQTIHEAAKKFIEEGYSRIPVYREDADHIVGVLLHKDVLAYYLDGENKLSPKQATIETLIKPVLYAPETKKISHLLQEFKSKQIHLAIVVDEYGGTEGIVTIEDILEEIVGEISDEFDFDEEIPFAPIPGGGWIVDAKMNILDIEKNLGIPIPQNPEYETIGGYVYHLAGCIPSKGWKVHHDLFDLEVLSSSERGIHKIRVIPITAVSE